MKIYLSDGDKCDGCEFNGFEWSDLYACVLPNDRCEQCLEQEQMLHDAND